MSSLADFVHTRQVTLSHSREMGTVIVVSLTFKRLRVKCAGADGQSSASLSGQATNLASVD